MSQGGGMVPLFNATGRKKKKQGNEANSAVAHGDSVTTDTTGSDGVVLGTASGAGSRAGREGSTCRRKWRPKTESPLDSPRRVRRAADKVEVAFVPDQTNVAFDSL
jgi:hypothetical protein